MARLINVFWGLAPTLIKAGDSQGRALGQASDYTLRAANHLDSGPPAGLYPNGNTFLPALTPMAIRMLPTSRERTHLVTNRRTSCNKFVDKLCSIIGTRC